MNQVRKIGRNRAWELALRNIPWKARWKMFWSGRLVLTVTVDHSRDHRPQIEGLRV